MRARQGARLLDARKHRTRVAGRYAVAGSFSLVAGELGIAPRLGRPRGRFDGDSVACRFREGFLYGREQALAPTTRNSSKVRN